MAVYKVPQDVEAEDKLLGPFSFRQFIYLAVALGSAALAWGLGTLFIPLAILPLPFVIFFGALALPLKKDQPMEIYLAAVLSFHLKPRKRLWEPDGITSLIEVVAPKEIEVQRTKNLTASEADKRFSYLADLVDSGGWSVRGVSAPDPNSSMVGDVYFEAQQAQDVFDSNNALAQSFDQMIQEKDAKHRQQLMEMMNKVDEASKISSTAANLPPQAPINSTQNTEDPHHVPVYNRGAVPQMAQPQNEPSVKFNPYPDSIRQAVIQPLSQQTPQPQPVTNSPPAAGSSVHMSETSTSEKPLSPDIINLASNTDLSIEAIAHEANRINKKDEEAEVMIPLR